MRKSIPMLVLAAIRDASNNIRLTICQLTDLPSVASVSAAPADSIAQALMDKAKSGVAVQVVVDQGQYSAGAAGVKTLFDLNGCAALACSPLP